MGDDRPAAYYEGDTLVARASAFGSCLWELIASLQGHEPQPWPDNFLRAFDEGNRAEPLILARLEQMGWVLDPTWAQRECDLRVGANRIIRCHPDGAGMPATMPTTPHGVEAKALHNSTWSSFRRHGIKAFDDGYLWQFSVEMAVMRMPLAIVGLNKGETPDKETGERPPCANEGELHIEFVTKPPYSLGDIVKRMKTLHDALSEDVIESGRPCDNPKQFPCRFIHVRPEPESPVLTISPASAKEFNELALLYKTAANAEKQAKKEKDELKAKLMKFGGDDVDELLSDTWKVTYVGGDSTVTDWDQMRADGIDVDKYQTKKPKAKSVRVDRA